MWELVCASGLWHGAPTHSVTASALTADLLVLLTADNEGRICAWSIASTSSATVSLRPHLVFVGPESPIISLAMATYEATQAVASVCADGTVTLWDAHDGYSHGTAPQLTAEVQPRMTAILPDARHVLVGGDSPFIQVVDLWALSVVTSLPVLDDWLSAIAVSPLNQPVLLRSTSSLPSVASPALIVTVSNSHTVRLSVLDSVSEPERNVRKAKLPVGAKVTHVAISANNSAMMLLRGETFYVYGIDDLAFLAMASVPVSGDTWFGASFLGENRAMAWTKSGRIYTFDISAPVSAKPTSLLSLASPITRPVSPAGNKSGAVVATATVAFGPLTDEMPRLSPTTVLRREPGANQFVTLSLAKSGTFAVAVDEKGNVECWGTNEAVEPPMPIATSPSGSATFVSGWPEQQSDPVTACTALNITLTIARGHASGLITITPLVILNDRKEREFAPWVAHKGAVRALTPLHVPKSPLSLLATAGDDCTVKVWDLNTRECIAVFHNHCTPVQHLLQAPELALDGKWNGAFLSVSSDRTICIYTLSPQYECVAVLPGHTGDIKTIRLRSEHEYLLVECSDGSLSVWDLAINSLETRLFGDAARELIGSEEDLLHREQRQVRYHSGGVAAVPLSSLRTSSFLLVLMNIKREVASLKESRRKSSSAGESPRHLTSSNPPPVAPEPASTPAPPPSAMSPSQHLAAGAMAAGSLLAKGIQVAKSVATPKPEVSITTLGNPEIEIAQVELRQSEDTDEVFAHMRAHHNFAALTLALPWGQQPELDDILHSSLALVPPSLPLSLALRGEDGLVSVMVPASRKAEARWTTSGHFTATFGLAAACIGTVLLPVKPSIASLVLAHVCANAPVEVPHYCEPSLPLLSLYWRDSCDEIMHSARSLFLARIDRLSSERRSLMLGTWSSQLIGNIGRSKLRTVLLLGILGGTTLTPASSPMDNLLPETVAKLTATELVNLTASEVGVSIRIAAVELLARGWRVWRKHVSDPVPFMQRLIGLATVTEEFVAGTATNALRDILKIAPTETVAAVRSLFGQRVLDFAAYNLALTTISGIISANPALFVESLHLLADICLHVLDAKQPAQRTACVRSASQLVQLMLRYFPMCSLHQETQRMAVGARSGAVALLDLRAGTKWAVLEGHKSAVTALSWSKDGKLLASYAMEESTVHFWRMETGLFGLGSPQRANSWAVSKWEKGLTAGPLPKDILLEWTFSNVVCLYRGAEQAVSLVL